MKWALFTVLIRVLFHCLLQHYSICTTDELTRLERTCIDSNGWVVVWVHWLGESSTWPFAPVPHEQFILLLLLLSISPKRLEHFECYLFFFPFEKSFILCVCTVWVEIGSISATNFSVSHCLVGTRAEFFEMAKLSLLAISLDWIHFHSQSLDVLPFGLQARKRAIWKEYAFCPRR